MKKSELKSKAPKENKHLIELKQFLEDEGGLNVLLGEFEWAAKDSSGAWYLYPIKPKLVKSERNWQLKSNGEELSIFLGYSQYNGEGYTTTLTYLRDLLPVETPAPVILACDSVGVVIPESTVWNELQALIDARFEKIVILNAEIDQLKEAQTLISKVLDK